ncbi:YcxB family protein [Undibacterium sp. Ji49W]|uniref:YcxB family protein n=1 Tax=Undibacterium sp. Ji49W TaxID=3413040 RepID=UPI003BEFE255
MFIKQIKCNQMEIIYKNTYWQIVGDSLGEMWRNKFIRTMNLVIIAYCAYAMSNAFNLENFNFYLYILFVLGITISSVIINTVITMLITLQTIISRGSERELGPHHVRLTEEGVVQETSVNMSMTKWVGINRVISNNRFIRIYFGSRSSYLIPRSAFPTMQESDKFLEMAKQYFQRRAG